MRIGIIALFMLVIGIMMSPFKTSNTNIKDINKKVDDELKKLLKEQKKIQAVKRLKQETGMELKEAKKYVDDLENEEKSFS